MNGLCITDAAKQFGVTSKTLRYYERVGLLDAKRSGNNNYRYYDEAEVERIRQILILRKMQIPIKDIIRIYENEEMSTVVEVFVNRINALDAEVGALIELRRITNDFLQTMIQNGITKISAIPLMYEEMDKQLNGLDKYKESEELRELGKLYESEGRNRSTLADIAAVSEKLAKPLEINIIALPCMRVLSSALKARPQDSDPDGFSCYMQQNGMTPGNHERFEFQADAGDVIMQHVPDDFKNDSGYMDYTFPGGLFAAMNVYLDEDLGERFRALVKGFDDNKYYQIDYHDGNDGGLRHPAMLEELISPDDQRELVSLLVPIKKRLADPALFDRPVEVGLEDISIAELEAANPILWTADAELAKLTPGDYTHYRITGDGEAEFIGWIIRGILNTNISVRPPFRVDIEYRQSDESALFFYHGDEIGYHAGGSLGNMGFGINTGNNLNQLSRDISFVPPIFIEQFSFKGRGAIKTGEYNALTWIIGKRHLAVIINGEIRYCGVNFPYMSLDLNREDSRPVVIGSHGIADGTSNSEKRKMYFRSIRVSQLADAPKNKLKTGELTMVTKQSNNVIPIIHRLVTDEYGENYWFNGCSKYVMECLGEPDYDYWFFAGLTGDVFTQHYAYDKYSGDALSCYMMDEAMGGRPEKYAEQIFAKCGYAATYVFNRDARKNTEMYLNALLAYIDKGIPVIMYGNPEGVFVGYEDYGRVLLYISGNNSQPERMPLDKALRLDEATDSGGWIFVGEKKESRPLAQLYREAIYEIPQHFCVKTDTYCFGAEAFRAWARDIENGKFDGMKAEGFDTWACYTNYVCVLATNGSCCYGFLDKARELNPDMGFLLEEVSRLYRRIGAMWNNDGGTDLEAIGGGFNITLEALQDKERRGKIAAKIREFADVTDGILRVLDANTCGNR